MSAADVLAWSRMYCDTTHLDEAMRRGFQFTVVDRGSFAECHVFRPGCGFSSIETMHKDVAEAKSHAEQQARDLNALAACKGGAA